MPTSKSPTHPSSSSLPSPSPNPILFKSKPPTPFSSPHRSPSPMRRLQPLLQAEKLSTSDLITFTHQSLTFNAKILSDGSLKYDPASSSSSTATATATSPSTASASASASLPSSDKTYNSPDEFVSDMLQYIEDKHKHQQQKPQSQNENINPWDHCMVHGRSLNSISAEFLCEKSSTTHKSLSSNHELNQSPHTPISRTLQPSSPKSHRNNTKEKPSSSPPLTTIPTSTSRTNEITRTQTKIQSPTKSTPSTTKLTSNAEAVKSASITPPTAAIANAPAKENVATTGDSNPRKESQSSIPVKSESSSSEQPADKDKEKEKQSETEKQRDKEIETNKEREKPKGKEKKEREKNKEEENHIEKDREKEKEKESGKQKEEQRKNEDDIKKDEDKKKEPESMQLKEQEKRSQPTIPTVSKTDRKSDHRSDSLNHKDSNSENPDRGNRKKSSPTQKELKPVGASEDKDKQSRSGLTKIKSPITHLPKAISNYSSISGRTTLPSITEKQKDGINNNDRSKALQSKGKVDKNKTNKERKDNSKIESHKGVSEKTCNDKVSSKKREIYKDDEKISDAADIASDRMKGKNVINGSNSNAKTSPNSKSEDVKKMEQGERREEKSAKPQKPMKSTTSSLSPPAQTSRPDSEKKLDLKKSDLKKLLPKKNFDEPSGGSRSNSNDEKDRQTAKLGDAAKQKSASSNDNNKSDEEMLDKSPHSTEEKPNYPNMNQPSLSSARATASNKKRKRTDSSPSTTESGAAERQTRPRRDFPRNNPSNSREESGEPSIGVNNNDVSRRSRRPTRGLSSDIAPAALQTLPHDLDPDAMEAAAVAERAEKEEASRRGRRTTRLAAGKIKQVDYKASNNPHVPRGFSPDREIDETDNRSNLVIGNDNNSASGAEATRTRRRTTAQNHTSLPPRSSRRVALKRNTGRGFYEKEDDDSGDEASHAQWSSNPNPAYSNKASDGIGEKPEDHDPSSDDDVEMEDTEKQEEEPKKMDASNRKRTNSSTHSTRNDPDSEKKEREPEKRRKTEKRVARPPGKPCPECTIELQMEKKQKEEAVENRRDAMRWNIKQLTTIGKAVKESYSVNEVKVSRVFVGRKDWDETEVKRVHSYIKRARLGIEKTIGEMRNVAKDKSDGVNMLLAFIAADIHRLQTGGLKTGYPRRPFAILDHGQTEDQQRNVIQKETKKIQREVDELRNKLEAEMENRRRAEMDMNFADVQCKEVSVAMSRDLDRQEDIKAELGWLERREEKALSLVEDTKNLFSRLRGEKEGDITSKGNHGASLIKTKKEDINTNEDKNFSRDGKVNSSIKVERRQFGGPARRVRESSDDDVEMTGKDTEKRVRRRMEMERLRWLIAARESESETYQRICEKERIRLFSLLDIKNRLEGEIYSLVLKTGGGTSFIGGGSTAISPGSHAVPGKYGKEVNRKGGTTGRNSNKAGGGSNTAKASAGNGGGVQIIRDSSMDAGDHVGVAKQKGHKEAKHQGSSTHPNNSEKHKRHKSAGKTHTGNNNNSKV